MACQGLRRREYVFTPDHLLKNQGDSLTGKLKIPVEAVTEDLGLLIYGLKNGYGGRSYGPPGDLENPLSAWRHLKISTILLHQSTFVRVWRYLSGNKVSHCHIY